MEGEEESYKAEMQGLYLINQLAYKRQVAKLDNQAVTKVAPHKLAREESDMDLGILLTPKMQQTHLTVEWIKAHQQEAEARSRGEKIDIRYDNITDGLA